MSRMHSRATSLGQSLATIAANVFLLVAWMITSARAAPQQSEGLLQALQKGNALMNQGRYDEAIAILQKNLPLAEAAGLPLATAGCYLDIGWSMVRSGRWEEGEANIKKGYSVALKIQNAQVIKSAEIARILGDLYVERDAIESALEWYKKSLERERKRSQHDPSRLGMANVRIADVLRRLGRDVEAVEYYDDALQFWSQQESHPNYRSALSSVVEVLTLLGRYRDAERRLSQLEGLRASEPGYESSADRFRTLEARADLREQVGDLLGGFELRLQARRAFDAVESGLTARDALWSRIKLARSALGLGRIAESLHEHRLLVKAVDEGSFADVALTAAAYSGLAEAELASGRVSEALRLATHAVELRMDPSASPSVEHARHLGLQSRCLLAAGRADDAVNVATQQMSLLVALPNRNHEAESEGFGGLSECYRRMGDLEKSIEFAEKGVAIAQKHKTENAWRLRLALSALLLERDGAKARVRESLEAVVRSIEDERADASLLDPRDRGRYFNQLRELDPYALLAGQYLREGRARDCLQTIERGRARGTLEALRSGLVDTRKLFPKKVGKGDANRAEFDAVESLARDLSERIGIELAEANRSSVPDTSADSWFDRSETEIAYRDAVRARAAIVKAVAQVDPPDTLGAAAKALAAGEGILVFELDPFESFVGVVKDRGTTVKVFRLLDGAGKPIEREVIRRRVREHYAVLGSPSGRAAVSRGAEPGDRSDTPTETIEWTQSGRALFESLMPIEAWNSIRSLERVWIVPDEEIHRIPFETLVVANSDENGDAAPRLPQESTWLDLGPAIGYVASANVLAVCAERTKATSSKRLDFLGVGRPEKPTSESAPSSATDLPGTERELRAIFAAMVGKEFVAGESHPRANILLGSAASERNVFEIASEAEIVHFATHGVADESPWASRSRLLLAWPDPVEPGNDGSLSLTDLVERWRGRLVGSKLVVLSACATGIGEDLQTEGVLALPTAFLAAGAPAVISTLWNVDDQATAALMSSFYRGLAKSKSGALAPMVVARREVKAVRPEPYYWGAFVLNGCSR